MTDDQDNAMPPNTRVDTKLPSTLLEGYARFRKNRFAHESDRYRELGSKGQKPETMVIACCDSRCAPETIFEAGAGDMFVVRNVANVVTPHGQGGDCHGVSSALEFAVQALQVRHIVVMGHGGCGGIAAFRNQLSGEPGKPLSNGNFIGKWISLLEPVAGRLKRTGTETPQELQRMLEEESIRQSIEHLRTFPFILALEERGEIGLYGTWFDISSGELWVLNAQSGAFERPQEQ